MNTLNTAAYEPMARCLHEYQLSASQERALFADTGFAHWYTSAQVEATIIPQPSTTKDAS